MAIQSFLSNRPAATPGRGSFSEPAGQGGFQRLFEGAPKEEISGMAKPRLDAPQVDVVEENGRVASIVVTCKCCERIEIACRY
jgi:hypothetical protein